MPGAAFVASCLLLVVRPGAPFVPSFVASLLLAMASNLLAPFPQSLGIFLRDPRPLTFGFGAQTLGSRIRRKPQEVDHHNTIWWADFSQAGWL